MILEITSKDNKIIKSVRSLSKKSNREKMGCFIVEGKRIVEEAIRDIPEKIGYVIISHSFKDKNTDTYNSLNRSGLNVYLVPDYIFDSISDTETPQGILAVSDFCDNKINKGERLLILDGISEPGNMGTIIRTAEAMGFNDIILCGNTVDIYSPKVVRSTMGSLFRLNFKTENNYDFINQLKSDGYKIYATALTSSLSLEEVEPADKSAIVIGNEAHGVSEDILSSSDINIRIDMEGQIESLNAAVAAAITMYKFKK